MAGFDFVGTIGYAVAAALVALLAYRVVKTLRIALGRPGPDTRAVLAHSLAVGRALLLIAVLFTFLLGAWTPARSGSPSSRTALLGLLCLVFAMAAETRWPRQSGAIRVARLDPLPLRVMFRRRYVAGSAFVIAATVLAVAFFLFVDSAVGALPMTGTFTVITDPSGATVTSPCDGCVSSTGTFTNYTTVSANSVRFDCFLLALVVLVGAIALSQIRRRRSLAGVTAEIDRMLRRTSAERVMRIVAATMLATVSNWSSDLRDALQTSVPSPTSLALSVSDFLTWVPALSLLSVLFLYLMGPSESSLRRAAKLPEPAAT